MAFFTETTSANPRTSIAAWLLGAIAAMFTRIADGQNRSQAVHRLQSLSDRELADIGVARKDILRHVYRDIYYV